MPARLKLYFSNPKELIKLKARLDTFKPERRRGRVHGSETLELCALWDSENRSGKKSWVQIVEDHFQVSRYHDRFQAHFERNKKGRDALPLLLR
jgi:hypothetical protein